MKRYRFSFNDFGITLESKVMSRIGRWIVARITGWKIEEI